MRDAQSFDELYRGAARRLLRYGYAVTGDHTEAQDLVQEAFARAWRQWGRLSAHPAPEAWPTSIPDRAFFVLASANRTGLESRIEGSALPVLCAARYPSESAVVQRRGRYLAYKQSGTPQGYVPAGSYRHTITIGPAVPTTRCGRSTRRAEVSRVRTRSV